MRVVNDRRSSARVVVRGEALLHAPSGSLRCRCLDISTSGISVVSPQPIKAKQRVRLEASFMGERLVFEARIVRRNRARDGHVLGLRFEDLPPPARRQLDALVRSMEVQAALAQQSLSIVERLPTLQVEPEPRADRASDSQVAIVPVAEPRVATVPPSRVATVPPSRVATVPPSRVATVPPSEPRVATVPPSEPRVVPPSRVATVPPSEPRVVPPSRAATVPPAAPAPRALAPMGPRPMLAEPKPAPSEPPKPVAPAQRSPAPTLPRTTSDAWWDALGELASPPPRSAAPASEPRRGGTQLTPAQDLPRRGGTQLTPAQDLPRRGGTQRMPAQDDPPGGTPPKPTPASQRWGSTMLTPAPASQPASPRWDSTMLTPAPASQPASPRWDSTMLTPAPASPPASPRWDSTMLTPAPSPAPPQGPAPRPVVPVRHGLDEGWTDEELATTHYRPTDEPAPSVSPTLPERPRPPMPARRPTLLPPRPVAAIPVPTLEPDVDVDMSELMAGPDAIDCTAVEPKAGTITITEPLLPDWEPGAPLALAELVDTDASLPLPPPETWEQLDLDAPPPAVDRTVLTPVARVEPTAPTTAPMPAPAVPRLSDELQAALDRVRRRDGAAGPRPKRARVATDVYSLPAGQADAPASSPREPLATLELDHGDGS